MWGYDAAHAISKIMMQAVVRIKIQTRVLFLVLGDRRLWPQTQKEHKSAPISEMLVRIVYTDKNVVQTGSELLALGLINLLIVLFPKSAI